MEIVIGRDAGPAGRAVRLLAGAVLVVGAAISLAGRHDAAAFLQAVLGAGLLLAVYVALLALLGERLLARIDPWVATFVLYLPEAVTGALGAPGLHVLPSIATVASALYAGVGLVVMSATGYGGCEVVSVANVILRRRQVMYCPYNAIDLAERAVRVGRRTAAYAAGVLALVIGGGFLLLGLSGHWGHDGAPVNRHWALLLLAPALFLAATAVLRARRDGWRLDGATGAIALGAVALALAASDLSGLVPQRVIWPPILVGGTILALVRRRK